MTTRLSRRPLAVLIALALWTIAAARPASAGVQFYDNLADFQAATSTILEVTFEGLPSGPIASPLQLGHIVFTGAALRIDTPGLDPALGFPDPPLLSNGLAGVGTDEMWLTFNTGRNPNGVYALGFDFTNNDNFEHVIEVYAYDGSPIGGHGIQQIPHTRGFVGFRSPIPVGWVHWVPTGGEVQDVAIDNVRTDALPTPAKASTWGAVRALYH